jgi:DNA-binding PadR family transcriptional regulator
MLSDGLIEESDERPDPELDDQRRRYYRLTDFGRRVAGAEAERLASLVNTARRKRLIGAPEVFPKGV